MSLVWIEGFDDALTLARSVWAGAVPSTSFGRLGGKGMRLGNTPNSQIYPTYTMTMGGSDTFIWGFAMQIVAWNSNNAPGYAAARQLFGVGNYFCCDRVGTTNNFLLHINSTDYSMDTDITTFPVSQWHYVEIKVKFHASTGTVEFRLDGSTTASYTGLNTGSPPSDWDAERWGGNLNDTMHDWYVDDIYACNGAGSTNNDFLGDIRVLPLDPDGNGNSSVLVGSDADSVNNYLLVNDSSTATYVGSTTEGDKDTYSVANMTVSSGTVLGVISSVYGTKLDSGNKYLRHVVRSGGTDYVGSSYAMSASPTWVMTETVWETDPATATTWSSTGVDAMEIGLEVRDA